MVSSRALEYITRFSKGVRKNTALKQIINYRNECKDLYREAESKNPMNYKTAESKRIYLEDMYDRIKYLGEARDYLQKEITEGPAKGNAMHSAVTFESKKEINASKPAKNKYFQKSKTDLRKLGIKDVNVVKYIIRFQGLGLENNSASYCELAVVSYLDKWSNSKDANQHDADYCDQADIAIDALHKTIDYFSDLQETIDAEDQDDKYIYNPGNDEYVLKSECY